MYNDFSFINTTEKLSNSEFVISSTLRDLLTQSQSLRHSTTEFVQKRFASIVSMTLRLNSDKLFTRKGVLYK